MSDRQHDRQEESEQNLTNGQEAEQKMALLKDQEPDVQEKQPDGRSRCCHCMEKHTLRSEDQKKALLNRLKRIEGQVRGVQQMLEKDAYCNDILVQSAAISAAMNAFNKEILAAHIHTCVVRDIRDGHDEVVDELVTTIQKLMK